ncbi:MAG: cyclic dehypoxanthinyl futalosine synthase, partial [Verrucomicrobiota bacterium]
ISQEEALELYHAPLPLLGELADAARKRIKADALAGRGNEIVTYIIDRNINYTNVCNVYCKFCNFYRTEKDSDAYVISFEEIDEKIEELVALGGNQILMQGGHHPSLKIDYYLDLLSHVKETFPTVNLHAFSPPEFHHFSEVFEMPVGEVIRQFREAGLGSIPGGGGEILVNEIRHRISPLKCDADRWLEIMEIAHNQGLNSSATMMFGHVESLENRFEHLERLRQVQDRTHGFTAFICWTFQSEGTVLKAKTVGAHEYLRMQALSRIYLDNIENVQASWVTQGAQIGQLALKFGANDFGSLMMEENVVSQAGATFRLTLDDIRGRIQEAGYDPRQRDNWYQLVDEPSKIETARI